MNLVTGGLGLVGLEITKMLLEKGEDVTTFSRSSGADKAEQLNSFKGKWQHISGSLASNEDIVETVKKVKPKTIYHIGAMLSIPSENNPRNSFETNIVGTFNLLDAARLYGVKQVIFASTTGTYGQDLDDGGTIDDKTIQRPITIYGTTKVTGELLGRYFKRKYDLDFRAIRLPAVIGPGATTKNVSIYNTWAIEYAILGKPYDIFVSADKKCPAIYFKDAARTFIELAAAPLDNIKTVCYNMVGIKPVPSAGQLRDKILEHIPNAQIGFAPEQLAQDYQSMNDHITWDDSSAEKEWGWKLKYDFDAIIPDFMEQMRALKQI